MLKECEGCVREEMKCRMIIEEDPKFRSLSCPCFECLVKVTCSTVCTKQSDYMWRRAYITYVRLDKLTKNADDSMNLVRES